MTTEIEDVALISSNLTTGTLVADTVNAELSGRRTELGEGYLRA